MSSQDMTLLLYSVMSNADIQCQLIDVTIKIIKIQELSTQKESKSILCQIGLTVQI